MVPDCQNIMLDLGAPVAHRSALYNCRIIAVNGKILLVRPKLWLVRSFSKFDAYADK